MPYPDITSQTVGFCVVWHTLYLFHVTLCLQPGCLLAACGCLAFSLGACDPVGACKKVLVLIHIVHTIVSIIL